MPLTIVHLTVGPAAPPADCSSGVTCYVAKGWNSIGANASAIQAICVVLSALAAFLVIRRNTMLSRREKTIDMVRDTLLDEDGSGPYTAFNRAMESMNGRDIAELFDRRENDRDTVDKIDQQINIYELIALSIRRKVFEEEFYWLWFRSQLLRDYDSLRPYINRLRHELAPTIASEFRWLAIRWKRRSAPHLYPNPLRMAWWSLTNKRQRLIEALIYDDPLPDNREVAARVEKIRAKIMKQR